MVRVQRANLLDRVANRWSRPCARLLPTNSFTYPCERGVEPPTSDSAEPAPIYGRAWCAYIMPGSAPRRREVLATDPRSRAVLISTRVSSRTAPRLMSG